MTLTFLKGTKQIIHSEIFDLKQNITFALCGHLVRQHIEMKAGTSGLLWKDIPAFRKITRFRVWLPGEEHQKMAGYVDATVHESVLNHFWTVHLSAENTFTDLPTMYQWSGKYVPSSYICQNSDWCWSCAWMFHHPPSSATEINFKAISPISKWKENPHTLQNAAIDLALTREILLKWISNKAVKLTALINLLCKTYLIMQ